MKHLRATLKTQLEYYTSLIKDAQDAETAVDILDGYDLILASHVIDKKFGDQATYNVLHAQQ
jgi:hypothetical protein